MGWVRKTKGNPHALIQKCPEAQWLYFLLYRVSNPYAGRYFADKTHPYYVFRRFGDDIDLRLGSDVANEAECQFLKAWFMDNEEVVNNVILGYNANRGYMND